MTEIVEQQGFKFEKGRWCPLLNAPCLQDACSIWNETGQYCSFIK